MLLTTPDKTLQSQFIEIDLLAQGRTEGTIEIEIVATLSPGAYGIDPTELYLN
jgi:hypothetical protein